jgi:phage terminase small subunit
MPQGRPWPRPPHGFDEPPVIGWRKKKISGQEEPAEPELIDKPKPIEVEPEKSSRTTFESADVDKVVPIIPPCPSYLKGAAAELWPAVVHKLVPEGDWDDHDSEIATALYCTYAAMATAAMQQISEHGPVTEAAVTGVSQHSPWRKVLHEAAEGVMRFGELLNLTPDARWIRHNERHERAKRRQAFERPPS